MSNRSREQSCNCLGSCMYLFLMMQRASYSSLDLKIPYSDRAARLEQYMSVPHLFSVPTGPAEEIYRKLTDYPLEDVWLRAIFDRDDVSKVCCRRPDIYPDRT